MACFDALPNYKLPIDQQPGENAIDDIAPLALRIRLIAQIVGGRSGHRVGRSVDSECLTPILLTGKARARLRVSRASARVRSELLRSRFGPFARNTSGQGLLGERGLRC